MKRYKLLRDLPTFETGDEFYLSENGDLVFNGDDIGEVAYCHRELEKFPSILKDWFEEIEENARWRGGKREIYWLFDAGDGRSYGYTENRDKLDNNNYEYGNYFKTEAEAEKYGEYLKALQIIKDDAKDFKPDWVDENQDKYYGYYSHDNGSLSWHTNICSQNQGAIYFETLEDLKESFEKHHKEWLIVLGVEE